MNCSTRFFGSNARNRRRSPGLETSLAFCALFLSLVGSTAPVHAQANDNIQNAQILTGVFNAVNGSNVGATHQSTDPNIVGNAGGASVWYAWRAPFAGHAAASTTGSNFDTLLGVYTLNGASLVKVAENNDINANLKTSFVDFQAVGGQLYFFDVDGYNSGFGPARGNIVFTTIEAVPFDINFDGHEDLLWQNRSTGGVYYWLMNGVQYSGNGAYIIPTIDTNWKVVSVADFNGDLWPDIVWQNTATGDVYIWLLQNGQFYAGGYLVQGIDPVWRIVGTPDLNGDGYPDLLWQNQQTGGVYYWILDNRYYYSGVGGYIINSIQDWKIVGTPDLNGDGQPDLLWQNAATGAVYYWLMNGPNYTGQGGYIFNGVLQDWRIVGTQDLNGDLLPDIIWQNQVNGDVYYWLMNGPNFTGQAGYIAQGILDWRIAGGSGNFWSGGSGGTGTTGGGTTGGGTTGGGTTGSGTTGGNTTGTTGNSSVDEMKRVNSAGGTLNTVAYSPSNGWVVVNGSNGYKAVNVPQTLIDYLNTLNSQGIAIRSVAFTPANDGWVVFSGRNSWRVQNGPQSLIDFLNSLSSSSDTLNSVAFTPAGGWTVFHGTNGWAVVNGPQTLIDYLHTFDNTNTPLNAVAFTPSNNGWVVFTGRNSWRVMNGPQGIIDYLNSLSNSSDPLKAVAFAAGGGWAVFEGQNGYGAMNVP